MARDLEATLGVLEKLVAFPTVSECSNRDLIRYVADFLAGQGVESRVFADETGEKEGLIAHIGPDVAGGVLLSGHTDVVPVAGQDWRSDPWSLTERDGRFYGRGTCDMKGFLALALVAVPDMVAAPLRRPIQLAFSYDEEIGCRGSAAMIAALQEQYPRAEVVIVGEPTLWRVVSGHKGGIGLTTEIVGKAAHSSMPHLGVSAIAHATGLIDWHGRMMAACRADADPASGFDPPHSTLQVGTIQGGLAVNIIPDVCRFETDIRFMPRETAEHWISAYGEAVREVEAVMRAERPEARIVVTTADVIPALVPEENGRAEQLARQLTGDNSSNRVSYQTEAGHFQAAGHSTIVCGPGDIAQAHQADEYVSADQLRAGQAFMARLIESCR